jgi:hypothetical protein
MKAPTLNGNIITIPFPTLNAAWDFSHQAGLTQFGMKQADDGFGFELSTPVTPSLEDKIPGILHGARARAKPPEKPQPPSDGPDGDGTPPGGGTPGTPVLDRYTYTEARAA